jgi:cytochrome c-type biogenesis protein CcmH
MSKRAWFAIALIVAAGASAPATARGATITSPSAAPSRATDAERALQGRLMAPCCWTQTLDVHESEISTQLRAEIHDRLARGDAADAIEDDFARRFGEKIRAVPKGQDPFRRVPLVVGAAMIASAIGLVWAMRRWTRRGEEAAREEAAAGAAPTHDAYDDRLDEELRRLDA